MLIWPGVPVRAPEMALYFPTSQVRPLSYMQCMVQLCYARNRIKVNLSNPNQYHQILVKFISQSLVFTKRPYRNNNTSKYVQGLCDICHPDIWHPRHLPPETFATQRPLRHFPPETFPTPDISHPRHYPPETLPTRDISHPRHFPPETLPTRDISQDFCHPLW